VWQHQNGGHSYIADSLHAQLIGDGYRLDKGLVGGLAWHELNCEQQAMLIEEAFEQGAFDGRRVSIRGRDVTDLSGKMRIHSLPLRFMFRVRATRAASIWVLVIQARSSVCRPNSPKSMRRLREAVPLRLPRWVLRYLTRLGINGMAISP
jgi:hypothetical protein